MNSIDVLYLSSIVGQGGAFRAAHRIHLGLSNRIDSKMLVLNSNLGEKATYWTIFMWLFIPSPQEKVGYHNDLEPLKQYPAYNMASHVCSAMAGTDVNRYIDIFNPKIVQIHWINAGYIKIEDLGKIKRKIVWRLADCCH